jgi:hypothetical protein
VDDVNLTDFGVDDDVDGATFLADFGVVGSSSSKMTITSSTFDLDN